MMTQHKGTLSALLLVVATITLQGCANFNYKRFAYDILRQEDCRINDVDPFCARSFVFEFDEYEQLRQEYLRGNLNQAYRNHDISLDF